MHTQESWHSHFFNHCQALFCIVSFEGGFREINAAWHDMLGYITEEIINDTSYLDLVHPDDYTQTNRYIEQLSTGATSVIFTNRYRDQHNRYHEILWHATLSPMEYAFCAIGIDITPHQTLMHQAQISLPIVTEQPVSLFKRLAEIIDDAVAISSITGELMYANSAYKKLFQCVHQEGSKYNYLDHCPQETVHLIERVVMPELMQGQSWEGELIVYDTAQQSLIVNARFNMIYDNHGHIANILILLQDKTQSLKNEKLLKYQQIQFERLLNAIPVAILYKDKNNRIIQANQHAAQLLSKVPEQLVDVSLQQLSPDFANQHYSNDLEVMNSGEIKRNLLEKYAERYWRVVKIPNQDIDHQMLGVIVFGIDVTVQFEIEEALQAEKQTVRYEREQFETIFHSAPLMIVYKDRKNNIAQINRYAAELFGYAPHELEGFPIDNFFDEEAKQYYNNDLEVMRSGKPCLGQIERYAHRYWQVDRIPYLDALGKTIGVVSFGLDITKHIELEAQLTEKQRVLQESERGLGLAMKYLPMMVSALDKKYNFVLWNEECERITGYQESEIVGNPNAWKLLYPDEQYRKEVLGTTRTMIQSYGGFRCWELTVTCKDGITRTIEWSATSEVQINHFELWCVGLETTDRGKMLEQLCEKEERLRLLVENMPVMLNAYNEKGELIAWNRQCENITGYKANEMVGNPDVWTWLYPHYSYRRYVQERLLQQEVYFQQETRLMCKDGNQKYIAWSSVAKQFPISGWNTWIIGEDVTAFKNMQKFFVKNNTLLTTALDNIDVGICVTDGRQHIAYANRVYCKTHGYTVEELMGSPFSTTMTLKSNSFVFRHYFSFLAGAHNGFFSEPYTAVDRQGNPFKVQLVAHRVVQETGQAFVLWTVTRLQS